jgi:hypothetical protein
MSVGRRNFANSVIAATLLSLLFTLAMLERRFTALSAAAAGVSAPTFEVDPLWPKPLPNHWLMGSTIGLGVDDRDHVWVVHRGIGSEPTALGPREIYAAADPPQADCCIPAPPVLEFDRDGNLVGHWGGPGNGYEWPESNHGITPDSKGNLWIGGNGATDGQILVFRRDGVFVKQLGFSWANATSNDLWAFRQVAKISLDERNNEAFVADGYGNHRVAVLDLTTGKIKRYWGAYGNRPEDDPIPRFTPIPDAPPPQQFANPVHCAEPSNDGLVYVCDRSNNRIQVFRRDGQFVREVFVDRKTRGDGTVWDLAFSRDKDQKFLFLADGTNEKIHVFDRASMQELTTFGDGGRQPGQFFGVHSIATDSKGNIFTTETYEGKRLQKFTYKGIKTVPAKQGVVWPTTR